MSLVRNGFQTFVNTNQPPNVVGGFASQNPRATVLAGAGALRACDNSIAGNAAAAVGNFAFAASDGFAYGNKKTPSVIGFVANELQTVITQFLGQSRLNVQSGFPITLYSHGDFWTFVASLSGAVAVGDAIYADQDTGAATTFNGVFTGTANQTGSSTTMTVTAVAGGVLRAGATLSGTGVDAGLTVVTQLTSTETDGHTGGKGTYTVSTNTGFTSTGITSNAQNPDTKFVAASAAPADASFTAAIAAATGVLTVSAVASGALAVGQFVQGVGTPNNVQITAQLTGSAGGTGTYQLNYNGPAVGSVAMTSTEGKLVKISRTY